MSLNLFHFDNIFVVQNYVKDELALKILTCFYYSFSPFPVNAFPNVLAVNVCNNIGRDSPFCSFLSFLIVSLLFFISYPGSSRDLTLFIMSSFSSFKIINAVIHDFFFFLISCICC